MYSVCCKDRGVETWAVERDVTAFKGSEHVKATVVTDNKVTEQIKYYF